MNRLGVPAFYAYYLENLPYFNAIGILVAIYSLFVL